MFAFCPVSMYGVGNCKMWLTAVKCWGNVGNFTVTETGDADEGETQLLSV